MLFFSKYHGLGNDFIVIDGISNKLPESILKGEAKLIKRICQRNFGIGADGLIIALPPQKDNDVRMKIFNSDGSEAEMCGNGIRCLVKFLSDINTQRIDKLIRVETLSGLITSNINNSNLISVDMGTPIYIPEMVPTLFPLNKFGISEGIIQIDNEDLNVLAVGMGNPHMIVIVNDLNQVSLNKWGKCLETNPNFPSKTNVHFVKVKSKNELDVLVWERGCGPTLACGTGACACAVATNKIGLTGKNTSVKLPGGILTVKFESNSSNVFMTGPAELIYSGSFDINKFT